MRREIASLANGFFRRIVGVFLELVPLSFRNRCVVFDIICRLQEDVDGVLAKKLECLLGGGKIRIRLREMTEVEAKNLLRLQGNSPLLTEKLSTWLRDCDKEDFRSFKVMDTLEESEVCEAFKSEKSSLESAAFSKGQIRFFIENYWELLNKDSSTFFILFSQKSLSIVSVFYGPERMLDFREYPIWDQYVWNVGSRIVISE